MTLSLLAILMLPISLKMVLDPQGMRRVLKQWSDSEAMQFLSSIVILLLTLIIFTTSDVSFAWDWDSLLTWLGVLTGVKGLVTLVPSVNKWKMKVLTEERLPIAGFSAMLVALALVYIDTQVL